jgi:carboxypeptidase C (cathepsin A)
MSHHLRSSLFVLELCETLQSPLQISSAMLSQTLRSWGLTWECLGVKLKFNFFSTSLLSLWFFASLAQSAFADTKQGACSDDQKNAVSSAHTTTINGTTLNYTATAGFLDITVADGSSRACIFYTSYVVPQSGNTTRPITFAFNGGPGSASLWLHMGFLGPKRVDMGVGGMKNAGDPFSLVQNDYSPLDMTDIVLIDPVATGYSTADGTTASDKFFGATNDYVSVATFINKYLQDFKRFASPKFLMGESYGGIRGGLVAHHLQSDFGVNLDGVIFISPWLSTTTTNFTDPQNYEPFYLFFPTFANAAWYHNKSAEKYSKMSLSDLTDAAENFARNDLRDALDVGSDLSPEKFDEIVSTYADFTGLDKDFIAQKRLRVSDTMFFTGLFDQRKVIGRYDSRFVGDKLMNQDGTNASDPSDTAVNGPFTTAIQSYLSTELNFTSKFPYVGMANITNWPFNSDAQEFGVMDDIAQALDDNPSLRIYVASGLYDLAVPFETVKFNFQQAIDEKTMNERVTLSRFPSGHMVYINPIALKQLKSELTGFWDPSRKPAKKIR